MSAFVQRSAGVALSVLTPGVLPLRWKRCLGSRGASAAERTQAGRGLAPSCFSGLASANKPRGQQQARASAPPRQQAGKSCRCALRHRRAGWRRPMAAGQLRGLDMILAYELHAPHACQHRHHPRLAAMRCCCSRAAVAARRQRVWRPLGTCLLRTPVRMARGMGLSLFVHPAAPNETLHLRN